MRLNIAIDLALVPLFCLSVITGVGLHVAGHTADHGLWHGWAVAHIAVCLLFLIVAVVHVVNHGRWYRNLILRRSLGRNRTTVLLTVLMAVVVLTGVVLVVAVDGANSGVGLWHYRLGLLLAVVSVVHIVGRWGVMWKQVLKKK